MTRRRDIPGDIEVYEHNGFLAKRTCHACPEQYEVRKGGKDDGEMMGYLRLRHGIFTVECPDCGGENVYTSHPKGDGIFDDEERVFFLSAAMEAIVRYWENRAT